MSRTYLCGEVLRETMIYPFPPSEPNDEPLVPATEFEEFVKRIKHVIGVHGSKLLFLDAKRWVCSVDTNWVELKYYLRHFPIPSYWQNQQRELLIAATCNGDILFVRSNEVAVINGGLEFEERVELDEAE